MHAVDETSSSRPHRDGNPQQLQPKHRAGLLLAAAQQLKRIALEHNVTVLVLNHSSGSINAESSTCRNSFGGDHDAGEEDDDEFEGLGDGSMEEDDVGRGEGPSYGLPSSMSLGTAWHHCVSTRIVLRQNFLVADDEGLADSEAPTPAAASPPRMAVLTKSCTAPCPAGPFPFIITSRGVEEWE
jgi:hypothetical protein